jgi:hypothetical protein
MEDDSSVLVSLSLTKVSGEGEVCDGGRDLYPTATLYMSPKCRSSKQQPYPRLARLGLVAVESTSEAPLDDVHGIIHRSSC